MQAEGATAEVSPGDGSSSSPSEKPKQKVHSNFFPWEKPANATVASFPYGPGTSVTKSSQEAPKPSMQAWIARWKTLRPRTPAARPLREDGTEHKRMKLIQLHMRLPLVRTQLLDVDVDAFQKLLWDIEENSEEQLAAIMAEAVQDEDGLYHWRGKMLQFAMEGGGYFDCRRPAFYGTFSKASAHVTGRNPLAQEPEQDYTYESDVDWESEAGDGEDLESDLGDEEEEEEDEEESGGFVVQDNEYEDVGEIRKKVGKLTQIVHDYNSIPTDMADTLAVRVLSDLPLVLARDKNVVIEEGMDFFQGDVHYTKAQDLDSAVWHMHKHPTACSFTYILPTSEHKFAGCVFLKNSDAAGNSVPCEGLVSGYIKHVPQHKLAAIKQEKKDLEAALAKKAEEEAAAARAAELKKQQASRPPPEQRREKQNPIDKMDADQILAFVTNVHGSRKPKPQLIDAVSVATKVPKGVVSAALVLNADKKNGIWKVKEDVIVSRQLRDKAEEAYAINSVKPVENTKQPSSNGSSGAQGDDAANCDNDNVKQEEQQDNDMKQEQGSDLKEENESDAMEGTAEQTQTKMEEDVEMADASHAEQKDLEQFGCRVVQDNA
jgi:hypothetical protein